MALIVTSLPVQARPMNSTHPATPMTKPACAVQSVQLGRAAAIRVQAMGYVSVRMVSLGGEKAAQTRVGETQLAYSSTSTEPTTVDRVSSSRFPSVVQILTENEIPAMTFP